VTTGAPRVSRRHFLEVAAAASGGLLLSLGWSPLARGETADAAPFVPNPFLRIDPDGTVTVIIPRPEMGQGVRTSLAMIVADELGADWSRVRIEQADLDQRYGEQYAGGSDSVQHGWDPLRKAGALARGLLIATAARSWGVSESDCAASDGVVRHSASHREISFGALARLAAQSPGTLPADPSPRARSAFTLIGTPRRGLDTPAIVTGRMRYGLDVRRPGMLHAAVLRSPVLGGQVLSLDDSAARRIPGVRAVVRIDADALPDFGENSPKPPNGVAVIADTTWTAFKARAALHVQWSEGTGASESTDRIRKECDRLAQLPPERVRRDDGDVAAAMASAAKTIDAVYELPLLAHATLEPMNCVVDARADRCEVWAPTQDPDGAANVVRLITGHPAGAVSVHPVRMGGGFGRRFYADCVAEALVCSRSVKAPVQVVWDREDDMRHDFYRPAGVHVVQAGVDGAGKVVALRRRLINAPRGAFLKWQLPKGMTSYPAGGGEVGRDDFPAGLVPNFRLEASLIHSAIPLGQWRAIEESTNVFVISSILDELAALAGRDSVAFLLDFIGPPRQMPYEDGTYDIGRLRTVIELAAKESGWGSPLPAGQGRGIAAAYANEAYAAEVAEVEVREGEVRVRRVIAAIDCGTVVNPLGAAAQVAGAVLYGLSAALTQEITVEGGRVVQGSFSDYPVLRIADAPQIEAHFVPSETPPLGLGEVPLPPIAPAVTNAIFNATGIRVRRLPIGRVKTA